jgi:protein O-mannosyl-transferase
VKRRSTRKQASPTAASTGLKPDLWICLLLLFASILVYSQVHTHDFINYDDPLYVSQNPHVRNGLTWAGTVWAFTGAHDANWIPLTWLSHMLDCQLFGLQAGLHHLTSVVLHALSTLLVFALFKRMTEARWPAAFIALAFALHPLHVESVAWVAERKDVLSALFFLLTLSAYLIYVERPSALRYSLVALFFACALMSKPMAVTLPFVALLLDVWPLKRTNGVSSLLIEKLPLFALSIGSSIVTYVVQQGAGAVASADQVPLQIRLENALISYVVYLEQFLWPANLSVVYPYSIPAAWQWMLAALALAAVTIAVLRERLRRPYLAVGWLWYLGTLVPVIGLVQVGIQSHADRYTYLPLIGISIMLAWGAAEAFRARHTAVTVAAVATCSIWALVTWSDLDYWQNTVTLFQHAIQVTGENYVAYNNLGVAMRRQGRIPEAISNFEIAQKIRPQDAGIEDNLGESLLVAGRIGEAAPHLSEAVRLRPGVAKAHIDWASALIQSDQPALAEGQYREALRLDPDSPEAQYGLGGILAMENRMEEARPLLERALPHVIESVALNPGDPDGHHNLGRLYAIMGRTNEAIAQFSETARLAPDDADAHYNLGVALTEGNRLNDAVNQFSAAIQLRPDHVNAHYSLGKTLVAVGRTQEAAREFTEALRLQPDFADARRSLNLISH